MNNLKPRMMMSVIPLLISLSLLVTLPAGSRDIPGYNELVVGDIAPVFKLASPDGEEITDLTQFRDEMPLVLFFGSYT
ncbi:MAG: hypothetical protein GY771_16445 [bacterium]|nr:hypothetical protein [bacterium]